LSERPGKELLIREEKESDKEWAIDEAMRGRRIDIDEYIGSCRIIARDRMKKEISK
jgi:hypothetical protein